MTFCARLQWVLNLWLLLVATTFTPLVTFAYDRDHETIVACDGNGNSAIAYHAVSVLATGEKENGTGGNWAVFAKFTEFLAAKGAGRATTDVLSDVTVISKGKVVGRGDVNLRPILEGIESGKITPRDIFQNREGLLPSKPSGYYEEFVHPTPGVKGAGSQRIIRGGGGELYYTPDHYGSFVPLN